MELRQNDKKVEILDDGEVIGAIYTTATGIMVSSDRLANRDRRRVDPLELSSADPGVVFLNLD